MRMSGGAGERQLDVNVSCVTGIWQRRTGSPCRLTPGMSSAQASGTMKLFTVDQANRTLPLVGRIVEDIVTHYARWRARVQEFELRAGMSSADHPDPGAEDAQRELQELAAQIDGFLGELREIGVEFKGYDVGLVDFPSEMSGRIVYLCWRLGERSVEHWHEVDAGFAGRQRLTPTGVA